MPRTVPCLLATSLGGNYPLTYPPYVVASAFQPTHREMAPRVATPWTASTTRKSLSVRNKYFLFHHLRGDQIFFKGVNPSVSIDVKHMALRS